jgi:HAD superfamily hydrolase (TIGR01549 family)
MIRAVSFDLDNTLIDFLTMKRKASDAAAAAIARTGLNMKLKDAQEELFKVYLTNIEGRTAFETFLRRNNAYNERRMAAAINAYNNTKIKYVKAYPGVKKTLDFLKRKGLKLAIISDAPKIKAYQRLDALGIADMFDVVVGLEDTNAKKPSVKPFRKALALLQMKAAEVMHVGDWPEKDVKGARKLGMKTCYAKYGRASQADIQADYEITRIEELIKIIGA